MARKRKNPDEPNLFALRCEECNRQLVGTESGYLSCPIGHGRLQVDEIVTHGEPCGSWFDDDRETVEPGDARYYREPGALDR